jgi:hypothetical protein
MMKGKEKGKENRIKGNPSMPFFFCRRQREGQRREKKRR